MAEAILRQNSSLLSNIYPGKNKFIFILLQEWIEVAPWKHTFLIGQAGSFPYCGKFE